MTTLRSIALTLCVAAAACVSAQTARADTIVNGFNIVGGTYGPVPSNASVNEAFASGVNGWYAAQLYLDAAAAVTYTYIGAEAGYQNQFYVDGALQFTHPGTAYATSYTSTVTAAGGLLDFQFEWNVGGGVGNTGFVVNGTNPGETTQNFVLVQLTTSMFSTYLNRTLEAGLYLALDDRGGGPDDNHDDMVIMISAAVPEPSSIALLGMALTGIGVAARRRRAARSAS